MAKNYKQKHGGALASIVMNTPKKTFVTSTGKTIVIRGLPTLVVSDLMKPCPIEPPTYTVLTASGEPEVHTHNETTLDTEDPVEAEANHKAWNEYIAAVAEYDAKQSETMTRLMLLRGIEVAMPEGQELQDWIDYMEFIGFEVPEATAARKYFYVKQEVIGDPQDLASIMTLVMSMSGLPKEAVDSVDGMFQRSMEETKSKIAAEASPASE